MVTRRKVGGYEWNAAVTDARRAANRAREMLRIILEESPGRAASALYLAQIATAIGDIQEAMRRLDEIGRGGR